MKNIFRTLVGLIIIILIIGLVYKRNYYEYLDHISYVENFLVTMQYDESQIRNFLEGERVDSVKDNEQLLEQIHSIGEIKNVILLSAKSTKRSYGNDIETNLIIIGSKNKITLLNVSTIRKADNDFKVTKLYAR